MIKISQDEYFKLKDRFDDINVTICSKRKKGANSKTYYCEERKKILNALDKIRKECVRERT